MSFERVQAKGKTDVGFLAMTVALVLLQELMTTLGVWQEWKQGWASQPGKLQST